MSEPKAIFWCDLETTGTEEEYDDIIEVGAVMTDFEFNQIGETFQCVITPSTFALGRLMENKVVRNMHLQNGLLEDILNADLAVPLDKAIGRLRTWIITTLDDPFAKVMLAGSGVGHFDRRFINHHMPIIADSFVYQFLDIGVVRRFIKMCGVAEPSTVQGDPKNHRALDDILQHLEEARTFRDRFQESLKPRVTILPSDGVSPVQASGLTTYATTPAYTPSVPTEASKPVKPWNDKTPRH